MKSFDTNNQIAILTNTLTNQLNNHDTQITGIQVNITHTLNGKSVKPNFEFWIHCPAGKILLAKNFNP